MSNIIAQYTLADGTTAHYALAEAFAAAHAVAAAAESRKRELGAALLECWPDDGPRIAIPGGAIQRIAESADKLAPDGAAAVALCAAGRLALLEYVAGHALSDRARGELRRIADALEVPPKVVSGRSASLRVMTR